MPAEAAAEAASAAEETAADAKATDRKDRRSVEAVKRQETVFRVYHEVILTSYINKRIEIYNFAILNA